MNFDNAKIKNYLLGALSADESAEIELFILENPDFEASLADAENDLIEDFVDGNLTNSESGLFHENFLVSARRRAEVEFLQDLKKHSHIISHNERFNEKTSFFESLQNLFRMRTVQAASILALVIIAAGIWWFAAPSLQNELSKEIAALNEKNTGDLAAYKNVPTLTLVPGVFRGNETKQILTKESAGDTVLLRLALPKNFTAKPTVNLYRSENLLAVINNAAISQNPAGSEMRLLLPAAKLEKGDYRLELQFDQDKTVYNFSLK